MGEKKSERERLDIFVMEFCTFLLFASTKLNGFSTEYLCIHFGLLSRIQVGDDSNFFCIHFGGNSNSQCSTLKKFFAIFAFFY